ncbi:MAG: integrase [Anaerolineaceae bacterium]|nr:integrase [Anaerolineaceae bacterium]
MDALFDPNGNRKYLTQSECEAFLEAARHIERDRRTFCEVLHYSGARISEVLNLAIGRIDLNAHAVTFESLKKRKKGIYRTVPLPSSMIERVDLVHGIRERQKLGHSSERVWTFSRTTAWRIIKGVMKEAGISVEGAASPKGLRHGYGVSAVTNNIPLTMVQKWLGHADLSTTAIYVNALGAEERKIAERMWSNKTSV